VVREGRGAEEGCEGEEGEESWKQHSERVEVVSREWSEVK
jgi:hypothetical protein